jgi:hypothetical protein
LAFRRYLFWGLTLMLAAVLASLVLQSRRREAARAKGSPPEIVRVAPATPTRIVRPADLELAEPRLELAAAAQGVRVAEYTVAVLNKGTVAYRDPMLELTCSDRAGRIVESRRHKLDGVIPPGKAFAAERVREESLPAGVARCTLAVLWAEIDHAAPARVAN